jgi:hypothetical protein
MKEKTNEQLEFKAYWDRLRGNYLISDYRLQGVWFEVLTH